MAIYKTAQNVGQFLISEEYLWDSIKCCELTGGMNTNIRITDVPISRPKLNTTA